MTAAGRYWTMARCWCISVHPEQRQYYKLERLWDEGTNRVELPFAQAEEAKAFLP